MKKIKNFKLENYYGNDGSQNYLLFQRISNTFKAWKFKELSDESIKSPGKPDNSLAPKLKWILNLKK